jgi:hypothetical protein
MDLVPRPPGWHCSNPNIAPVGEGEVALGWFIGHSAFGHLCVFTRGNEDFGPNSLIYFYPESEVLIIVLTHVRSSGDSLSSSRNVHAWIETVLERQHFL